MYGLPITGFKKHGLKEVMLSRIRVLRVLPYQPRFPHVFLPSGHIRDRGLYGASISSVLPERSLERLWS